MNSLVTRLTSALAQALTPDERNAVLGDLAESGETPLQTLFSVSGLVIRHQAALWLDWRPWLALIGVVALIGPRLLRMGWEVGTPLFLNIQIYLRYGSLYSSGLTSSEATLSSLLLLISVIFWSWTSGFALGSLSRKSIWINAALCFAIWSFPLTLQWMIWILVHHRDRHGMPDIREVAVMMAFQAAVQLLFLVLPFTLGVRQGLRKLNWSMPQACIAAAVMILVIALSVWTGGWPHAAVSRWATGAWNPSIGWQSRFLSISVFSWPVIYLLISAFSMTGSRRRTL